MASAQHAQARKGRRFVQGVAKRGPKPLGSNQATFRKGHSVASGDNDMIQRTHIHQRQRLLEPRGDGLIGTAWMGGVAVPDPDELLADIIALENWRAQVHKRSEETAKKRKAGPAVAAGALA